MRVFGRIVQAAVTAGALAGGGLWSCSGESARNDGDRRPDETATALLAGTGAAGFDHGPPQVILRPVDLGGDERAALHAHAPAILRIGDVAVPPNGRLHLGAGILDHPELDRSDGVGFAVRVASGGEETEIWRRLLDPGHRPEDRGWIDVELALDRWAGETVDLVLATEARQPRRMNRSVWSGFFLTGSGPAAIADRPIRRELVVQTLEADPPVRLTPPPGTTLTVAGKMMRHAPEAADYGPIEYRVVIDGSTVWNRSVPTSPRWHDFAARIPLEPWWGRQIEIAFETEIGPAARGHVEAHWLDLALIGEERVARLPAGAPNLLFVVVDTVRADHLSTYGYERETSPTLDRLAAEGIVFDQAISQSSWTMPATASLLTGLYPTEHGVTDAQPLPLDLDTVAERLQRLGFSTLGVSANPLVGDAEGFHQGHERFVHLPWARAGTINELVVQLLREHAGSRWFMYVHYIDPHDPYAAPEPYGSTFLDVQSGNPRFGDPAEFRRLVDAVNFGQGTAEWDETDVAYLEAAYDGEIRYWDAAFGQLLDTLLERGLLDDTFVIVTSDHGEEFLEHGKLKHGPHLYEESIRVPLLVWGPGLQAERHPLPVETRNLAKLAPWLLGFAGEEPGLIDVLAARRGLAFSHTGHGLLDGRPGRVELASVRDSRWKFLEHPGLGRRELYDLHSDPGETTDLHSNDSTSASRYALLLGRWLAARQARPPASEPEVLDELRALGYIR